jgi:hypothetical protein
LRDGKSSKIAVITGAAQGIGRLDGGWKLGVAAAEASKLVGEIRHILCRSGVNLTDEEQVPFNGCVWRHAICVSRSVFLAFRQTLLLGIASALEY